MSGSMQLLRAACRSGRTFLFHDDDGAAVIEFALGAIVFFGIIAGIIDISGAMYSVNNIEHAAKEGVRYAAIHGAQSDDPKTDAEIEAFVKSRVISLDSTKMTVSVNWSPDANFGSDVTITVNYIYNFFFEGFFPAGSFTMTAKSTYMVGR